MNTIILSMAIGVAQSCMAGVETGELLGMSAESSCAGCVSGLQSIDVDTGHATLIGEFGVNPSEGALAVGTDGTLYGAFSGEFDSLVTIDPVTAEWSIVGPFGFDDVSGLAFGPDGTLYGYDDTTCQLITVDPGTGEGAAIGPVEGFISGGGLAFAANGTLYALGFDTQFTISLFAVELKTGAGTLIGPLGDEIFTGAALAVIGSTLYASATFNDEILKQDVRSLYEVDPKTGGATVIGPFNPSATYSMGGMAFLPGTGDVDRDGDVDHDDFLIFESCFTGPDPAEELPIGCLFLDVDQDGDIDCDDWIEFINAWTADEDPPSFPPCDGCEGDANGDGTVDPLDSGFVLARFGCPVGEGDPECDIADQNGDGLVDPLDVGFVLARFGPCE
ncbi:MAG: hypothetical protein IID37_11060 [Planctomycetes bacterium]|nr:hypothetical protein [Planctomycetota bacterium]